jgi:biopolymer transport protein ExbB
MSHRKSVLALMAGLLLLPVAARAWWNEEWTARTPIKIDTSATGANVTDPIGDAPVLVRLHAGNFKFDAAKEDGSDLRFVLGDDKTPLGFHMERYDMLLGEALIWVEIPDLRPGAKTDLWLYYGNSKAVAAEDAKGTFDQATSLVYHFGEKDQPARDSTVWANQALSAGTGADALIGRGLRFEGTSTVAIPAATSLAWAAGAKTTWSVWIKPADANANGVIFSRRDGGNGLMIGLAEGKPFVEISAGAEPRRALADTAVAPGGWHHLAVTTGEAIALYVDGGLAAKLAASLPALNTSAMLGGEGAPAASAGADPAKADAKAGTRSGLPGFKGDLDELEISKVDRPAGFVRVAAVSQGTDPGKFVSFGQDEEAGGAGTGYFTVILKSVTLDGWVIIGVLAILSFISWVVMIGKASYLSRVERANDQFAERFRHQSVDLTRLVSAKDGDVPSLGEEKALRDSPLYRIFQIASEEIRKRVNAGKPLTAEAIESIRAGLDAGLVRENQRLSQRIVMLTIAISGGPFLGLLGTVVGVMITFAAIAAAGDVNVNAIAPGIAAALVATVAGLAVAIPALFGYNWLLTRIKNVGATMQVFVDELVTKIAEAYAERERSAAAPGRTGDGYHLAANK